MKRHLALSIGLAGALSCTASYAQLALTGINNSAKTIYSKGAAEVVVNGQRGWGYKGSNGGTFHHNGPATATLTVNGVYDAFNVTPLNPGKDYFNGLNGASSVAEVAGTVAPVFGDLYLNNGDTFRVANTAGIRIGNTLSFSNTITKTSRSNAINGAIVFQAGAGYTSSLSQSDLQYVDGYVTKEGNTPFTFPVGDQYGADIRTLTIAATSSAGNAASVAYWKGSAGAGLDPTGGAHSLSALDPSGSTGSSKLTAVSAVGFWDFVAVNGTDAATITVLIPDVSGAACFTNAADLRLVGWNTASSQWENLSGSTGATGTAEGSSLSGTLSDISGYSALGIGTVSSMQPLPLKLLSFNATPAGCGASLRWETASESGLLRFDVQYSVGGASFEKVGELPASNAMSGHNYQFNVAALADGPAYLRIKAVEAGGTTWYSPVEKLTVNCDQHSLGVSPNPASDFITIHTKEVAGNNWSISIIDVMGKEVVNVTDAGNGDRIDVHKLAPGMYWLHAASRGLPSLSKKIIKR